MIRRTLPTPLALSLVILTSVAACIEDGEAFDDAGDDLEAADDEDEIDFRTSALENTGLIGGIYLNTNAVAQTALFTLTNPNHNSPPVHGNRLTSVDLPGSHVWNNVVYLTNQATGRVAFKTTGGATLTGANLNGTIMRFETGTTDTEVKLVQEIYDSGASLPGGALYTYHLQVRNVGTTTWKDLCTGDSPYAVFADGDWVTSGINRQSFRGDASDGTDTISISCLDGAIAKCITHGKRPTDATGDEYHEACVRAFTAAYDSQSRTVKGVPIDIHEKTNANQQFVVAADEIPSGGDFLKEAEWGLEGPTCVNRQAIRRWNKIPGCPQNPDSRTVANCVIVNPGSGVDVPECSASYDYSTSFQYGNTLFATYTSKTASGESYDKEQDVYWGVESNGSSSYLFKGILKSGLQTITNVGQVRQIVNGVATNIEVDGLVYSDLQNTLIGFQIDAANSRSRMVRIRPNGIVRNGQLGPWFSGIVRGAELNRGESWIVAIVRGYTPDAASPDNKEILINPNDGTVGAVRNMVIWDANANAYVPFNVSNGSDIARREIYVGIQREWYIMSHHSLYSLVVNPQTINGQSVVLVDPKLRFYGDTRFFAGLTYIHPTNNEMGDGNPNDDAMLALDIKDTDELLFANLSAGANYGLTLFTNSVVPAQEGINGDLASWNSSVDPR